MEALFPFLSKFSETTPLQKLSDRQPLIREIQILLKRGGFFESSADGLLDRNTITAFQQFKQAAYLEYPNLLGKSTAQALLEISEELIRQPPTEALETPPRTPEGKSIQLFDGSRVYLSDPIPGSRWFTWGEATKNGSRLPRSKEIAQNIINHAIYLDKVRNYLGNRRISVNSWHRPSDVNRAVGGAQNSTHIQGFGSDITVQGIPPLTVAQMLHTFHGSKGGIGKSSAFTHIDNRGYYARWNYGS